MWLKTRVDFINSIIFQTMKSLIIFSLLANACYFAHSQDLDDGMSFPADEDIAVIDISVPDEDIETIDSNSSKL